MGLKTDSNNENKSQLNLDPQLKLQLINLGAWL